MQTFLPYSDFAESARCLDSMRLGKQRVEALTILRTLLGITSGWRHHPAVKMWAGFEPALLGYLLAVCAEWERRGYADTCRDKGLQLVWQLPRSLGLPLWLGAPEFHASHRSNLLRKDLVYYGQFGWAESSDLSYVWPTHKFYGVVPPPRSELHGEWV